MLSTLWRSLALQPAPRSYPTPFDLVPKYSGGIGGSAPGLTIACPPADYAIAKSVTCNPDTWVWLGVTWFETRDFSYVAALHKKPRSAVCMRGAPSEICWSRPPDRGSIRLSTSSIAMSCGVGTLYDDTGSVVDLRVPFCDKWDCEECRPRRCARVRYEALAGKPTQFLTLSWRVREGDTPASARKRMGKAWPHLHRWMCKEIGEKIEYFVVVEATKKGWPHFHILLRCKRIERRKIKNWWRKLTGSYIVKWETVWNVKGAAFYLTNYLKKGLEQFGKSKRYFRSENWISEDQKRKSETHSVGRSLKHTLRERSECERILRKAGYWTSPSEPEPGTQRLLWILGGFRSPPDVFSLLYLPRRQKFRSRSEAADDADP